MFVRTVRWSETLQSQILSTYQRNLSQNFEKISAPRVHCSIVCDTTETARLSVNGGVGKEAAVRAHRGLSLSRRKGRNPVTCPDHDEAGGPYAEREEAQEDRDCTAPRTCAARNSPSDGSGEWDGGGQGLGVRKCRGVGPRHTVSVRG